MYITKQELSQLVDDAQIRGRIDDRLAEVICQIVRGYNARYRVVERADEDDYVNGVFLRVATHLYRIDTTKNVHSWITTLAANHARESVRNNISYDRKLHNYYRDRAEHSDRRRKAGPERHRERSHD